MALEIGLILCAIFELICVPVTFAGGSLWTVTGLWLFFGVVLSALYIRLGRKHLAPQPEGSTKRFGCGLIEDVKKAWKERDVVTVFLAVFLLIVIAVQISFFVFGTHLDADDAMYLGNATAALETNSLFTVDPYTGGDVNFAQVKDYVLSPLSIVYASLGQIFHVSPVILAHTILPPFLILLAYLIYSMLAVRLFDKGRERLLFLCFLAVVHAMSFVTTRTLGAVLLLRIWQGKAIVCSILIPLLFVWFLDFLKDRNVWFLTLLTMTACCLCSFTGAVIAPCLLVSFAFVYGLLYKKWKRAGIYVLSALPNLALVLIYVLIGMLW